MPTKIVPAKRLSAVCCALAVSSFALGCSKGRDEKANTRPELTRAELREQQGAVAKAKIDKIVAVLNAAMKVPRVAPAQLESLSDALRVGDLVVGKRRAEDAAANALLFSFADVTQEFGRMLDPTSWAQEKAHLRWKTVNLSNSAAGFFDLSGVARWLDPGAYYEKDKGGWKVSDGGLLWDLQALERTKYVVVVREVAYSEARKVSADTFKPGFYLAHALVYRVDDAELVGQLALRAESSGMIASGNFEAVLGDLRIALRKQIDAKLASSVDENAVIELPKAAASAPAVGGAAAGEPPAAGVLAPAGEGFSVRLPGSATRSAAGDAITYKLLDPGSKLNFIVTIVKTKPGEVQAPEALRDMTVDSLRRTSGVKDAKIENVVRGADKGALVRYGLASKNDPARVTPVTALVLARPPSVYSLYVARLPGGDPDRQQAIEREVLDSFALVP